jgi:hypothetical protein
MGHTKWPNLRRHRSSMPVGKTPVIDHNHWLDTDGRDTPQKNSYS